MARNTTNYNPFGSNEKSADIRKRPRGVIKKTEISESRLKRIKDWATLYRRNIQLYAEHYFQVKTLHDYQKMMLYEIGAKDEITISASRATAKSWIVGLGAICIASLYPKSEIVIVASTKGQAGVIVGKIQGFYDDYPNIQREITKITNNENNRIVEFVNTSKITVVALSDNSRGIRSTCIIREECNSMKRKDLLDSVIAPMRYVRPAPFRRLPQYSHLTEESKMISISSAGLKINWWYPYTLQQIVISVFGDKTGIQSKDSTVFMAFDYLTSLEHGIKSPREIASERKASDYISFSTEYQNIPYGIDENAFFSYDDFDKARVLKQAFYPKRPEEVASGKQKYRMPKLPGEIRLVGVDLASSAARGSDNTAINVARLIPKRGKGYERQIVYSEISNGVGAPAQALRIRQIMTDFEADTLVMDFRNLGNAIFNIMTDVIHDDIRGVDYPPITVAYHETIAHKYEEYMQQTINPNAIPCIYPIYGTAELNSKMAVIFKDKLKTGMIKLLEQPDEVEKDFAKDIGFKFYTDEVGDWGGRPWLLAPFEQTTQLINEALSLTVYVVGGNFRLVEPKRLTKDRIVSLIYLNYYASLLDTELLKGLNDDDMYSAISSMNRSLSSNMRVGNKFGRIFR